jgi:hypothetical protein
MSLPAPRRLQLRFALTGPDHVDSAHQLLGLTSQITQPRSSPNFAHLPLDQALTRPGSCLRPRSSSTPCLRRRHGQDPLRPRSTAWQLLPRAPPHALPRASLSHAAPSNHPTLPPHDPDQSDRGGGEGATTSGALIDIAMGAVASREWCNHRGRVAVGASIPNCPHAAVGSCQRLAPPPSRAALNITEALAAATVHPHPLANLPVFAIACLLPTVGRLAAATLGNAAPIDLVATLAVVQVATLEAIATGRRVYHQHSRHRPPSSRRPVGTATDPSLP